MRQTRRRLRPRLLQAMVDAFKQPDIRGKLLFTFLILVIFRFVAHIPVPGANLDALHALFRQNEMLGMLDLFSGGAMRNLSVVAMGVYPYITASIIMQVLTPVIPRLQALAREGEAGRNKLNQYTHWLMVPLAMFQGYGQLMYLQSQSVEVEIAPGVIEFQRVISGVGLSGEALLPTVAMVFSMAAGTMFLVWLGERITEKGIGNGISLIIFSGIVASLPQTFGQLSAPGWPDMWRGLMWFSIFAVIIIFGVVIFTEAQRRIPVQYSKSVFRGGRMYRQAGASHIPMRVNSAGMIPIIFAMSIMLLPGTIASYFLPNPAAEWIVTYIGTGYWLYWFLYFLLVVLFTFFYTIVVFQQQNLAETLQRQGGFIPGIRPGKPTGRYLSGVLNRITWGGAFFLGLVAIMPFIAAKITNDPTMQMVISSTALLIVVGVVLDTMRQIEAQLVMRRYEGFIK